MYKLTIVLRKDGVREVECEDFTVGNGVLFCHCINGGKKSPVWVFPLDMVLQCHGVNVSDPIVDGRA